METYETPVFLRPRRFGKSLRCSILEYYYDINRKDNFQEFFGNLEIGKNPTGNQNKYLVLRFNFSKVGVTDNIDEIEQKFNNLIYIIIDEYDNFTNQLVTNHQDMIYKKITDKGSWLQTFYKVIKAGVGDCIISKVYITGVLPITMDDLTSGYKCDYGDVDQINKYSQDINEGIYMGYSQKKYIVYVVSNKGYVAFKIDYL